MNNKSNFGMYRMIGAALPDPRAATRIAGALSDPEEWCASTTVRLGWRDRLRVLFGRRIHVHITFEGRRCCATRSSAWVDTLHRRRPLMGQRNP